MTFDRPVSSMQQMVDPSRFTFMQWAMRYGIERLFQIPEDREYSLFQICYTLMKRMNGLSEKDIMDMDAEKRDAYFKMELELIEHEKRESKKQT